MNEYNGLVVLLQTTESVVPGSNPASFTVENSEDRQNRCVNCNLPPEAKKEIKFF